VQKRHFYKSTIQSSHQGNDVIETGGFEIMKRLSLMMDWIICFYILIKMAPLRT